MARVHDTAHEADHGHPDDALDEMRAEIAAMRAELHELRAHNAALATQVAQAPHTAAAPLGGAAEHRTNRRGMLRLAGAAAAGAAAAAVGHAGQAAAADGEDMRVGNNHFATRVTRLSYGTDPNGTAAEALGANPAALFRVETNFSNSAAVYAIGSGHGIIADGSESGFLSYRGKYSYISQGSSRACLLLSAVNPDSSPKTPPPTRGADVDPFHFAGEMDVDSNGDLWWCVETGLPGTWRKIAGPTTAGAFHAISPARVYDSRVAEGPLGGGESRIVSIKDGRDGAGVITTVDVVPVGASAIAYNLTVADTVGGGFLAVAEGTSAGTSASSINWSATGQLLANGLQVKIDDQRRVRVFSGGAGTTNFLIDVVGYYR